MSSTHNIIRVIVIIGFSLYFVGRYYNDKAQDDAQMSAVGSLNSMLAAPSVQPVQVNDSSVTTEVATLDQPHQTFCKAMSEFALTTMDVRQHGVPMSVLMDEIAKQTESNQLAVKFSQITVTRAYNEPQLNNETDRIKAAHDFKKQTLVRCSESFQNT